MLRIFLVILISFSFADPPLSWDSDVDGSFDDIANYQNSSSLTSQITKDGIDVGSPGDMFAAFVGDELRGIAPNFEVTFGPNAGKYFFLLLTYSNASSGETITFQFYDSETDVVYNINETYDFVADDTQGNLFAPIVFTTGEINDSYCSDSDQDGICDNEDDCVGELDECGVCNGDGIADGACDCDGNVEDCTGTCGGSAVIDDCGVCDGGNASQDCAGVCGGTALEDNCGTCDSDTSNDCEADCNGVLGGSAVIDCQGVCGGTAVSDCLDVCNGAAVFDECGVCDGNNQSCDEAVSLTLNQETGWDFYQSTNQAAYGFINPISINGEVAQGWESNQDECILNPYSCDVIGAFHNSICVGWNYISPENNVTVMGNNTIDSQTSNYLEGGDIPVFYIFDSSTHEIYSLSDNFAADPYSNFAFNISFDLIDATVEVGGCVEEYAFNYDVTAQIQNPFDACFYILCI